MKRPVSEIAGRVPEHVPFSVGYTMAMLVVSWSLVFAGQARAQAGDASRCESLATLQGRWPDPTTRLVSSRLRAPEPYTPPGMIGGPLSAPTMLPEHCEVFGIMHERLGTAGQHYAIRFHLRLPTEWNGRFFFQGGGGTNGVVGGALGFTSNVSPPALLQGFAVVSQDSGHDNASNSDPTRGGAVAFGFDPRARADYGHSSFKVVARAAKAIVTAYYAKRPQYSYFVGCSKGGQEGMLFAQRDPDEFDGIVAAAPGFSLPRAAVAEAWDVQSIASLVKSTAERAISIPQFAEAFSESDLNLIGDAILSVCDADDGVKDGLVSDFMSCTDARVRPVIEAKRCVAGKTASCLSSDQITALERIYHGPRDSKGRALYSNWQWDAGIADPGWRLWKLGSGAHNEPALNVTLGGSSLAAVFTTPPTRVNADLPATLDYQLRFDFDADAARIYATDPEFPKSAWDDIAARSSDLDRFRAHGGKLIVPHGVSDPVFSILDTLDWYREVDARNHGQAKRFVKVFPVPGMGHCSGGPATDGFDAFKALMDWVEHGRAPEQILATAGTNSPWPGRSRPLCAYPTAAHYVGHGSIETAESFVCR
jgi:feruloyl esterase